MKAALTLVALGTLVLGCSPSGPKVNVDRGQNGAAGSTAPGELDRERARAALINAGDLGKGWEAQVADPNDSQNPIAQCVRSPGAFSGLGPSDVSALEVSPSFFFSTAQGGFGTTSVPVVPSSTVVPPPPATTSSVPPGPPATSASTPTSDSTTTTSTAPAASTTTTAFPASGTGWAEVVSYAAVASTVDVAKKLFPAVTVPPVRDCVVSTAEADLAAKVAPDATPTGVTVEPLLVGQTGDESTAIRAVLAVTTAGTTVAVNLDLVGIRRGKLAAGLCIISTGDPPPLDSEYDLAARLGLQIAPLGA